ncbi:MAG: steroid monooxygenase [Ilumatobacteraceae bacterium]|nr:steroid monooxygenase [Ilumatobacteraceae bacterium]
MSNSDVDVVVVGAGFAGMYLLHELRKMGFSSRVLEAGDDVGGTWYWNRYPGARCDIATTDYQYTWDPELYAQWTWSEKHATQPEILRYAQLVATKHDLYSGIDFNVRADEAKWDDKAKKWNIRTSTGETIVCRHYVMATGCLSVPKDPDITGTERFAGNVYVTGRWPHEGVDFTGKRVAVIGTGSSGIQSIPIIAEQAKELVVFQRTPNFSMPAYNGPPPQDRVDRLNADRAAYVQEARLSGTGVPLEMSTVSALSVPKEVAFEMLEESRQKGELLSIGNTFMDSGINRQANEVIGEFMRTKVRSVVKDPKVAELLSPYKHGYGTKRPCMDTGYFETFNKPHVRLVDLGADPIHTITETGIDFGAESKDFDAIVYATGFDAMTGAIVGVNITGKDGVTLKKKWEAGPLTYLGLTSVGFPNLFMITGPGSPSVLSNMMVSIEQHVEWIRDILVAMREQGFDTIEPTPLAEDGWRVHCTDCADITIFQDANSWYMGANVPGKPRVMFPYIGGVGRYRQACDESVRRGYLGFELNGVGKKQCNDGLVRQVQPDVDIVLEMMGTLNLPAMDSMTPTEAREFSEASSAMRPPGPEVGEIIDATLPGAAGDLEYRLYRPATAGPHPVMVYFHGGGWVFGSHVSDDPLCRELCVQSNTLIVSVNYRHAPEARFPAAAQDGFAALKWVHENVASLGGIPGQLAVGGWSAGGNVAAVVAQMSRDNGGPTLSGQLLLCPVTDGSRQYQSYIDNRDGYLLTKSLMEWFWNHYADESDRKNPQASPLLAESLSGLPPAMVVTCQFDPLRDEGDAYARALSAAGVAVDHVQARGHIHTSITMVDMLPSGAPYRRQMAQGLQTFFHRA